MMWLQEGTVASLRRSNCRNSCCLMDAPRAYRTLQKLSAPRSGSAGSEYKFESVGHGFGGHCMI